MPKERSQLAVVAEAAEWFDNLAAALKTTIPDWVNAFPISSKEKIYNNELSYRIVANSLRDQARALDTRTGSRVAKGTFRLTFAGGDKPGDEDTEIRDAGDRSTSGAGSRKKKGNSGKRKRTTTIDENDKTYKACYGYHLLGQ